MKLSKTQRKAPRFKPVTFLFMGGLFQFQNRTDLDEWSRKCKAKGCIEDPMEYGAKSLTPYSQKVHLVHTVEDAWALRP